MANKSFGEIVRETYEENIDKIIDGFIQEFIDKVKSDCVFRAKQGYKKADFALLRDFQNYCSNNHYSKTLYSEETDKVSSKLIEWAESEKLNVCFTNPHDVGSCRIENTYDTTITWN